MGKRQRRIRRELKKLKALDDGLPLHESYTPLGQPPAVDCEDDMQLERRLDMPPGLYYNMEIGEDPTGWV